MGYGLQKIFEKVDIELSAHPRTSLRQAAEGLGVNRHTVEKALRRATGLSFRAFQKDKLLLRAFLLLESKHGTLMLKQVAAELGYSSLATFSRFVKANTGQTPSQIRNCRRSRR